MTTRRARVTFADKKNAPTLHGKHLSRAEGDYEEATGILWNVRAAEGVDASLAKDSPIGVHLPTGNLIQFVPEGVQVAKKSPQEVVDELNGVTDPDERGGEGEVISPQPGADTGHRVQQRQPDPRAVPVTEAARKAAAAREAKIAAARGQTPQ